MLLDHIVNFCDNKYKSFEKKCGCSSGACNHPSGKCSGSCYNCLFQIHFPNNKEENEIFKKQYDCQKMLFHYVCQYSYLYTTELLCALNLESSYLKGLPYFHIISFGCGGCTDLMAFEYFMNQEKLETPFSYLGLEINSLWEPIHEEIYKYYSEKENAKFNIPKYKDAFELMEKKTIKDANIIVISYLLSYLYNTGQTKEVYTFAKNIAKNVIAHKPSDQSLLFIINDVNSNKRGRTFFNDFKLAIHQEGLKLKREPEYRYFDTGDLNYPQTHGFEPYDIKKCIFEIPRDIKLKYHAMEKLNKTIQLIMEVE